MDNQEDRIEIVKEEPMVPEPQEGEESEEPKFYRADVIVYFKGRKYPQELVKLPLDEQGRKEAYDRHFEYIRTMKS